MLEYRRERGCSLDLPSNRNERMRFELASPTIDHNHVLCQQCGEMFKRRSGQNKFCAKSCWTASEKAKRIVRRVGVGMPSPGLISDCKRCGQRYEMPNGRVAHCGPCRAIRAAERQREYRERHPEKVAAAQRVQGEKRRNDPEWREKLRAWSTARTRRARSTPRGNLDHLMGQLLRGSLAAKAGRTWADLVGYSVDDLMAHIEKQFLPKMSWQNMGDWHIDHIVPKSSFSYDDANSPEFMACWAMTNLRPLWARDNLMKSNHRTHLI